MPATHRAEGPSGPPDPGGPDAPATDGAGAAGTGHILATAKGGGFLAAGTVFEYGIRFLIAIVLTRALGVYDYGLYTLAISAASLFAGISLVGTDDAMVRYVAIMSRREDHDGVAGTLQIGLAMAITGGLVMGAILFVLAGPVAVGLFDSPELERVLRLFAFVVPFLAVSNSLLGIARGFKRMDAAAFAQNGVQSVVRLALVGLLAVTGWLSLYPAAIAFGIADIAASVALIVVLNRHFPLRSLRRSGARRDVRAVFGFALPLWMSGLLRQFRTNIQNLLLGTLGSASNVGVFGAAGRVNMVSGIAIQSIYVSSRPLMAQLHDARDRASLRSLYAATSRWTLTLAIPFFLPMVLYPTALLRIFGEDFATGATALTILACATMIGAATGTCQGMLDMTGHTRLKLVNTVMYTALLIGVGAWLIPGYGAVGAATATLVAMTAVNVGSVIEVRLTERLLPYDRTFLRPVAAAVLALGSGLALRAWIPVTQPIPALFWSAVVVAIYGGLLLGFGLEAQDREIVERVRRRAGRMLRGRRAAVVGDRGTG